MLSPQEILGELSNNLTTWKRKTLSITVTDSLLEKKGKQKVTISYKIVTFLPL
jgi:hypothetical protein